MKTGEKITKLRKLNNLTQEQLADLLRVSRQSVSNWELNTAFPETKKLIKISELFNCSLDYLLNDEIEEMNINSFEVKNDNIKAILLTYLSFPPIFGWIIGIVSLKFQKNHIKNKIQIGLSILGMIVSLTLTALMVIGIMLGL